MYSVMSPIILPFTVIYFCLAYWTAKYNFVFLFIPKYEGVRMTRIAVDRIIFGLALYQACMIGVFGVSLFAPGSVGAIILVFITIIYRMWLQSRFGKLTKFLPLDLCPKPYTGTGDVAGTTTPAHNKITACSNSDGSPVLQQRRRVTYFGLQPRYLSVNSYNIYRHPALLPLPDSLQERLESTGTRKPMAGDFDEGSSSSSSNHTNDTTSNGGMRRRQEPADLEEGHDTSELSFVKWSHSNNNNTTNNTTSPTEVKISVLSDSSNNNNNNRL